LAILIAMPLLAWLAPTLSAALVATAPPPITPHALTATDLEAFFDGVVPLQLDQADVAGAVVAVVKDGKVLFMQGYGYADVATQRPVSPDSTLFRPGSISKLFTWTAVLQQVEQGKLDLDRDINTYLDFHVPSPWGRPVTLRDLMTHRPGFEETLKDLWVVEGRGMRPLSEYLPAHLPAQIFPPGTTPAYSNYGATLAAYIVQRVSGQPFNDYVEQHIFGPLHMTTSTFQQPLPRALAPLMSSGYDRGSEPAKSFEMIEVAPAGGLSTTAADMTHFMIAHLSPGHGDGVQILQPATVEAMHARQNGWPSGVRGGALGFYEESRNGHRVIGHGGDTDYFHSGLYLIPDANVGIFISCNSTGRGDVPTPDVVFDRFMQRYFPDSTPREPTVATALADDRLVAGTYVSSRRSQTNILGVTSLLSEINVDADPTDSTIVIDAMHGFNGQPKHYREVGPQLFREVDGTVQVAFVTDSSGRRTAFLDFPYEVFQYVGSAADQRSVNVVLMSMSFGVMLLTLAAWPIGAMVRVHYGRALSIDAIARHLRTVARCICIANLAFVGLATLAVYKMTSTPQGLGLGADFDLRAIQVVGLLGVLGTLVVVYAALRSWREPQRWLWSRVWTTCLALACVVFAWWMLHWHLLNFTLHY
jgi:CubicO group peptidase (beta-lactamase class C family)